MISGFDPATDVVETSDDALFGQRITIARVTRRVPGGRLKVVLPHAALVEPWPEEFLWRPVKALGVVEVWWSLVRSPVCGPTTMECVYQPAGAQDFRSTVPRDAVTDREAWKQLRPHLFQGFLCAYQDDLDERERLRASMSGG